VQESCLPWRGKTSSSPRRRPKKIEGQYAGFQLKDCRCGAGCKDVYYLDPKECDPFEAYYNAFARHVRARQIDRVSGRSGQNEGGSGRVEQSERGMGGAPCDDPPGPEDPKRHRRLDGRQSRVARIPRLIYGDQVELIKEFEGVLNPCTGVEGFSGNRPRRSSGRVESKTAAAAAQDSTPVGNNCLLPSVSKSENLRSVTQRKVAAYHVSVINLVK
jgi:hypothetical protein